MHLRPLFLAVACLLAITTRADNKKPSPSNADNTVIVAQTTLVLNGAGFRYKNGDRLSHVQIFARQKFRSMDEFLKLRGPKRIIVTMMRDVPAGLTGKALSRGIEENLPRAAMAPLVPSLLRLSEVFSSLKNIATGDQIIVDWVPEQGSLISYKGTQITEAFTQPEFFAGFSAIWIGNKPMDPELRRMLLGQ